VSSESQAAYDKQVLPYLKKYCWYCHAKGCGQGGFQVDTLDSDFLNGKTADHWCEAIDQINVAKIPKPSKRHTLHKHSVEN
jgi:hypothetical protein